MSHRAAIYRVRARPQGDVNGWRLCGDIDEAGTWLGTPIDKALVNLNGKSRDGKVTARHDGALQAIGADQVGCSILSGRSGVVSVIEKPGQPPFDRTLDSSESMRSAVLFDLPRGRKEGRLAVHVPDGRSCKGIVETALRSALSSIGFVLELGPIVPANALQEAVERDAVEKVTLIKHDPSKAEKFSDAAQWGGDEDLDRLELTIPSKRNRHLKRDPLKRFLDDPTDASRQQLIEFEGLVFDEVAVTVEMPDGTQRTFFLDGREGGHAMTTAIDVRAFDRYGATAGELSRELRNALVTVSA
jgi:hypothetical protein